MTRGWRAGLLLALALAAPPAARAQPTAAAPARAAAPAGLSPVEAQRVIDLLQDPKKRADFIENLQAIAKAAPAGHLAPHSLGAQLLYRGSHLADALAAEAAATAQTVVRTPLLFYWIGDIAADPAQRAAVLNALWRAALVVGCAVLLEQFARALAARPVAALARHAPSNGEGNGGNGGTQGGGGEWRLLRRLPFALARFAFDLVPIGVFWATGSLLSGFAEAEMTRSAISIVIAAYTLSRGIVALGRMLASPQIGRLRLFHIDHAQAAYLVRWLRLVTVVAVFGTALVDLAVLFGLYES